MMGFDGTEVTPQIKHLIEKNHLGTILLTAKNLTCESVFRTDLHFPKLEPYSCRAGGEPGP